MAVPVYTYWLYDLLTMTRLREISLYGVNFDRHMNGSGSWTGTFKLQGIPLDGVLLDVTEPGRTWLFIDRSTADGHQIIGGGPIWAQTYQEAGKSVQLNGQSFESFLYHQLIDTALTYTAVDKFDIVRALIDYMQSDTLRDIGLEYTTADMGNPADRTYKTEDTRSIGEALQSLSESEDGFDWYIEPYWGADEKPHLLLKLGAPLGMTEATTNIRLAFPDDISNFWATRTASDAGTKSFGIGEGNLRAQATDTIATGVGYPRLDIWESFADVSRKSTLQLHVNENLDAKRVPIFTYTAELASTADGVRKLGKFSLGDMIRHEVAPGESFYHPMGHFGHYHRIVSYSVTPPSSEQAEQVIVQLQASGGD
jgi:hypothetical protein